MRVLYRQTAYVDYPPWAGRLHELYWVIRVEGRDKAKRRRYYRYVRKERLRIVETGVRQELVDAFCRYLVRYDAAAAEKYLVISSSTEPHQLSLF